VLSGTEFFPNDSVTPIRTAAEMARPGRVPKRFGEKSYPVMIQDGGGGESQGGS
jgi:hypothetical protein